MTSVHRPAVSAATPAVEQAPKRISQMRKLLDGLYLVSGGLAAAFLAVSCLIVMLQVGANLLSDLSGWLWSTPVTLTVPSYAHLAGYAFAAASFLGLGYTFRTDGHIRVSVLIRSLSGRARAWLEAWCLGFACLISLFFSWAAVSHVADSAYFADVTPGMVAIPLWIPQSAMALGAIILSIAIIDRTVEFATGTFSATAVSTTEDDGATTPDVQPQALPIWNLRAVARNDMEKISAA